MQSFELDRILTFYRASKKRKLQTVMASLVGLKGSSYRKPGVRMLFARDGSMMGAISGGCVEKEIFRRAEEVFTTGNSKVISYDGRYRLGCEGFLYVLIEMFSPSEAEVNFLQKMMNLRRPVSIQSYYQEKTEVTGTFGSIFSADKFSFSVSKYSITDLEAETSRHFNQQTKTVIQLLLIGSSHDTATLCAIASGIGWDVNVVCSPQSNKTLLDFPGAKLVNTTNPEHFDYSCVDSRTAVVLMNHNFAKDLHFLLQLAQVNPIYTGILGSVKRWNRLQDEMLTINPEINLDFLEKVYSPAGLDIGSETTEEISLAIISEVQAVFSDKLVNQISALSNSKSKKIA